MARGGCQVDGARGAALQAPTPAHFDVSAGGRRQAMSEAPREEQASAVRAGRFTRLARRHPDWYHVSQIS
jgi:hypothetical protein